MGEDRELKKLQFFLIRTILLTMLIVSVAEYGIMTFLNRNVLPVMLHFFFPGQDTGQITLAGILYAVVLVLGILLLRFFSTILPNRAGYMVASGISSLREKISGGKTGSGGMLLPEEMGTVKEILLLLCLVAILVILALPFFLGGLHVTRIVIREFKAISLARENKQKEYEQKRNLMLSDIAHDLRTPITTVSGYARALSDGLVAKEKEKEYLEAIMTKSERMSDLINYLFDYVKTDSASFKLQKEITDICEMTRECVALLYQDFEDGGMEIEVDIPEEPCLVMADRLQLSRCITNLLTNAIRHNEEGCRIGALFQRDEDGASLMIADSGGIIPADVAEHLFEPFVMGDESRNSRGGSGLGLSIAKKIVELHGFDIRLLQQKELAETAGNTGFEKAFLIRIPDRILA